jgi:hypothetical protein
MREHAWNTGEFFAAHRQRGQRSPPPFSLATVHSDGNGIFMRAT